MNGVSSVKEKAASKALEACRISHQIHPFLRQSQCSPPFSTPPGDEMNLTRTDPPKEDPMRLQEMSYLERYCAAQY